ncbi:DedA family protein [Sulfurospirillum sp. UCH001]|uniref:DedA family protein n=1 Tax=Sulfurospirillum sp. UCH001 TaxID=1581011 RepID=UPI000830FA69|nr:DedA family protein [Sulfurospirillum sp. UCH001]
MEAFFIESIKEYGYIILFFWSILEGESGLVMAGLLSHTGDMNLFLAIFIAGLGGFAGDQLYFYIGRFNKSYVHRKLKQQKRKLALAHLLLKKHGWPIIFLQRYLYGLRTIIPIAIGLTGYSAKKYALINLIAAWCWSSVIILPVWYFGNEILSVITYGREHWYFALPLVAILISIVYYYINSIDTKTLKNKAHQN